MRAVWMASVCVAGLWAVGGAVAWGADNLPKVLTPKVVVPVEPMPPFQRVLPQDDVLPADLSVILARREDILAATVVVEMGVSTDNPQWMMGQRQLQVFLEKLATLPKAPVLEDSIWPHVDPVNPHYRGVRVVLQTADGKRFAPILVFEGKMTAPNGTTFAKDYGRFVEYFLFGTARMRRDQMIATTTLPVFSFEQCRLMGQRIIETNPRQCLFPDKNVMIETDDKPTLESAKIKTFDDCLLHGKALIYTFPRRCLAAGGRVLTEPPQVYEAKMAQIQAEKEAKEARLQALVDQAPQNTPMGYGVSESLPVTRTTVVAMPTPRAVSPVDAKTAGLTVAAVSNTKALVPSVKAAVAAARSVLAPVAPSKSVPLPRFTLGQ